MTRNADPHSHHAPAPGMPATHTLRLSASLRELLANRGERGLTLGYIIDATGERAFGVLMAFLTLPFMQPIPLPGLSTPFGLLLALLGVQLAVGAHRPWVPQRLARWHLPQRLTTALLRTVASIFSPMEKIIRPRMAFVLNRGTFVFVGAALVVDALLLSLPLPIPASNTIPAWMAMIKILGLTEDDGATILIGIGLTAAAVAVGVLVLVFGTEGLMALVGHHGAATQGGR